jgi:hypothetical protein
MACCLIAASILITNFRTNFLHAPDYLNHTVYCPILSHDMRHASRAQAALSLVKYNQLAKASLK